jgi:F420-dependent oxidoreductase-like protein
MRYGVIVDNGKPLETVIEQVRSLEEMSYSTAWTSQTFGWDALTLWAVVGRDVPRIELGTAVIPTYPRHPLALAGQALTTQAATNGRLALGIGLSHQIVVEGMWGYSYDKPARHMREYLSVLLPALRGEQVSFEGETLKGSTMGPLQTPGATPPAVLLAALAPVMLKLAGSLADGTSLWMTGPKTVAEHIVPTISAAADEAGRPTPRVSMGLPVCITNDPEAARERANKTFAIYGTLPSYRAMLDREGAASPADVAIIGDENEVTAALAKIGDTGATDFAIAAFGTPEERDRTIEACAALN